MSERLDFIPDNLFDINPKHPGAAYAQRLKDLRVDAESIAKNVQKMFPDLPQGAVIFEAPKVIKPSSSNNGLP